jgi:hypothetical protein
MEAKPDYILTAPPDRQKWMAFKAVLQGAGQKAKNLPRWQIDWWCIYYQTVKRCGVQHGQIPQSLSERYAGCSALSAL